MKVSREGSLQPLQASVYNYLSDLACGIEWYRSDDGIRNGE